MPELRRCGWSLAQLGSNGAPVRTAFGTLPDRLQSVGRAERHALLQVTKLLGQQARFVATDLLALAQEASSWGPELERARSVHATVWEHLRQQPCRPEVFWVPAREGVDGYLAAGLRPVLCAGNLWAGWFAKQGALQRTVSEVYPDFYAIEVQYFKQVAFYIGWAMQRCLAIKDWAPEARDVPAAPPPPAPKLTVVEHSLARVQGKRGVMCTGCGRRSRAEAGAAARQFVGSSCLPTPLARLKTAAEVAQFGAGPYWMGDAEGLGAEARFAKGTAVARRCTSGIGCGARGVPRAGPPTDKGRHQRTYVSDLAARRDRHLHGLDPKTGRSWATGTLVHDESSSVGDSSDEGTDEAVVAHGYVEAPLADAQGTAARGSPAAPCGGRAEEALKEGAQETATRGAPAELR
ncbi:unnamed protein product, partial [Prorocentrum cordatum]